MCSKLLFSSSLLVVMSCLAASNASARVCFLPDCEAEGNTGGDINMNINSVSKWCEKEGFTYYSAGKCPDGMASESVCSRDPRNYLRCTKEQWCKNNGYNKKATDCTIPEYASEQCQELDLYKSCVKDTLRACKDINPSYTNSCSSGWQVNPKNACVHDGSIGICCNKCTGYSYTASSIPSGKVADKSCSSCDGTKYTVKDNPCSGFQTCGSGCTGLGSTCLSGTTTKYSSCQCDPCPGYYACGGSWQYCTGSKCSADTSRCSNYCVSDYFPNSCSNSAYCNGIYRSGYCSGSCNVPPPDPCAGYYDCGGTWQYCTGTTCSNNSSKCSVSCVNDYFPNACSSASNCNGVYRNGYCSGSCDSGSGGSSGGSNSDGDGSRYYKGGSCTNYTSSSYHFCCDDMWHSICNTYAENCTIPKSTCNSKGGRFLFVGRVSCGGAYSDYSMYYCSGA